MARLLGMKSEDVTEGVSKGAGWRVLPLPAWSVPLLPIALLLPRIVTFVALGVERIAWRWQLDYVEGINLNSTLHLAAGYNIYAHNGPEGFLSTPYPPVLYMLNAPFTWLMGASLGPGRASVFVSTVAIAILLYYMVHKATSLWSAGVLAGALWLSLSPVIVWSALYKQDMPALALGLGGGAWVMNWAQRPERGRMLYVGAFILTLAIYTKQSTLGLAAASTIWLLIRDMRVGLRFLLVQVLLIVAPFALVNMALQGGLWEHLVLYHNFPLSPNGWRGWLSLVAGEYWPLLLVSGLALLFFVGGLFLGGGSLSPIKNLREKAGSVWGLASLLTLFGIGTSVSALGYEGAIHNHLLSGLLPLCLLAGLVWTLPLSWVRAGRRFEQVAGYAAIMLLVGLLVAQAFLLREPQSWYYGAWPNTDAAIEMQNLDRLVAGTPGYIYSEDNYLLLKNGRPVLYEDASTFGPLARQGSWDPSVLRQWFSERKFSLVFLQHGSGRLKNIGIEPFVENYTVKYLGKLDTYEPKPWLTPQERLHCTLSAGGAGEDSVLLKGVTLSAGVRETGIQPGQLLQVTLYWQPSARLRNSYATFVHLVDEQQQRVAGQDNPQTGAAQPSTAWTPGQVVTDTATLPMPQNLTHGRYQLVAGMYRMDDGNLKSLSSACEAGQPYGEAVSLGWIDVKQMGNR